MRAILAPRVFFVVIIFIALSFFASVFSRQALAFVGDVGTHVGQGDIGSQEHTINFVKGKNVPAGYPITVMVNIESSVTDMQKLATALAGSGMSVNIRVLGITMGTTTTQVQTFATNVAQVSWPTSPKPIIIFGNELNAYRGNEWGSPKPASVVAAATKYDELLGALEDNLDAKFDLAGVALDPYHADKATDFIDTAQGSFASTRVNSFATNVYQDVPTSSGLGANLQAGVDLYTHLAATAPKARKVFTEFGYNPFDKDVKKHLDFYKEYESQALPGGFEYATALIPNLCAENVTQTNQWYYYVLGKIYDENYQEVNENCVAKTDAGTFIYPGPVDNFYNTAGDTNAKMGKFMDIMANDYLLTCSPQIQFQPTLTPPDPTIVAPDSQGKSALINLLTYCGGRSPDKPDDARCLFRIDNQTVSVIPDNARLPLIRSDKPGRTGSLEGFFSTDQEGINNLSPQELQTSFLLTAPYTKLTSRTKICQDNVSFLTAISSTCGTVSQAQQGKISPTQTQDQQDFYGDQDREVNSCGLDTKVDGFHLTEIYNRVSAIAGEGNAGSYCTSEAFMKPTGDESTTAQLVMKVSPITPNAYRIGYLVVYVSNKGTDQLTSEAMISRIVRPMDAGYLQSIFKIVPVLLPANFGIQQTNVVRDATGDAIDGGSFEGVLKRTINPLVSSDMMKLVAQTAQENKDDVRGKMTEFGGRTVNDGGMVWLPYCNNPLPYSASGLSSDDTALNCAMADYINANLNLGRGNILVHPNQEAPCRFYSDLAGGETAEILNSPLRPEWMSDSLKAYEAQENTPSIKVFGQVYASRAQIESMINPEDAKLRVFLAVPEADFGLIKDYEKYLLQTVLSKDLYEKVTKEIEKGKNPETNGFLRMMGVELRVSGGTSKSFFTSTEDADAPPGTLTVPRRTSVTGSFDLATSPEGANPVLWGGWLSKFAYTYTANVTTSEDEKPFNPFDLTNRRLEPYWLGGRQGSGTSDSTTNSCMKVWVPSEVAAEHAQFIREHLMGQRTTTAGFAGWEQYYSGYLADGKRECSDGNEPAAGSYDAQATQYLFESIPECDNKPCYEYILDRTLDESSHGTSDGLVVDPYISIAIALNENGGLKTARVDRLGQHFGVVPPVDGRVKECSNDNEYLGTIPEKLEIMLNTLVGDYGKTGPQALSEYGYSNGGTGLNKIIGYLSDGTYDANACP